MSGVAAMSEKFLCLAILPLVLPADAADVLTVREEEGIDRWTVDAGRWTRTGEFVDGKALKLKPTTVVAADGLVYVGCARTWLSGTLEKFAPDGRHLGTLAELDFRPYSLVRSPDGKCACIASRSRAGLVHRVSLATGEVKVLADNVPIFTVGLAFGPDGLLYLSSSFYGSIAVFDVSDVLSGGRRVEKVGTIVPYDCQGGFAFGGENLTKLVVPGTWHESIDLEAGKSDTGYPAQPSFGSCLATVRVRGEVYAADRSSQCIARLPATAGPLAVVAEKAGRVSSMVNLTEAFDGTDAMRVAAAGERLRTSGRKLFVGNPALAKGVVDFERMHYNNPGLEVEFFAGTWPILSICADDALEVESTTTPRICRIRHERLAPYLYSAGVEVPMGRKVPLKHDYAVPCGEPVKGIPRKTIDLRHYYVDMNGDGVRDCVCLCGDWSEYGDAGPQCPIAYDASGRWLNGRPQFDAYLFIREGAEEAGRGRWQEPRSLLPAGFDPKWNGPWGEGGGVFADFDSDGDVDLVYGDFRSEIWYFENVGGRTAPQFAVPRRVRAPDGQPLDGDFYMLTLHGDDYDGDGKTDLIGTEEDGRIGVFLNTGALDRDRTPVFARQRYFIQKADVLKFACFATPFAVDWDGDGDQDLICGSSAGYIAYFENLSGAGVECPKWAAPKRLTVRNPELSKADLWLSGKVICARSGDLNSPQGPAEAKLGYSVCTVADWDGDGFLDVVANDIKGSVVWFRNPGQKGTTALEAPRPVEVEWTGPQPQPKWEWRKPPEGKALRARWRSTPLAYDWNGDGLVDLIMLDAEHHLALYERKRLEDGRLVLLPPKTLLHDLEGVPYSLDGDAGGSGRRKFCAVDWDGDGRTDILMDGNNVNAYLNRGEKNGKTVFEKTRKLARKPLSGHTNCPTAVDFNGDGVPDLVTGAEDGNFYYLRNSRAR